MISTVLSFWLHQFILECLCRLSYAALVVGRKSLGSFIFPSVYCKVIFTRKACEKCMGDLRESDPPLFHNYSQNLPYKSLFNWETNHRPPLNGWKLNLKAFISPWIWKGFAICTLTFSSVVMPTQCYLRWTAIMLFSHWSRPGLIHFPCSGSWRNAAQSKQVFLSVHWAFQLLFHFIAKGF